METPFDRTISVIGKESLLKLQKSSVAIFGLGGVGGYCVEALARAGVGKISLIDKDVISVSNLNRQVLALNSNIGQTKVSIAQNRIKDINPSCEITIYNLFYLPETSNEIELSKYDAIADCIDNVTGKIELICKAKENNVYIISSMGTGNKMDPCGFKVSDIYKTKVCPLAKVMRHELKSKGINKLPVVYSEEEPIKNNDGVIGSMPFVPGVAGLIMASEIIKELIK